jgi:hypothetical protein
MVETGHQAGGVMATVATDRRSAACWAFWSDDRTGGHADRVGSFSASKSLSPFVSSALSTLISTTAKKVVAGSNLRTNEGALVAAIDRVRIAFGLATVQHQQAVAVLLGRPAPSTPAIRNDRGLLL